MKRDIDYMLSVMQAYKEGKTIEQKSDDAIKQVVEDETSSEFLIKPVMNKSQRTKRKLG